MGTDDISFEATNRRVQRHYRIAVSSGWISLAAGITLFILPDIAPAIFGITPHGGVSSIAIPALITLSLTSTTAALADLSMLLYLKSLKVRGLWIPFLLGLPGAAISTAIMIGVILAYMHR